MKKRYTTLLILCILLAAVAGAVVLLRSGQAEDADSASEMATILETEADQITSLEWTAGDASFALQRTETDNSSSSDGWDYPANEALPLDSVGDDLADLLAGLTAARTLDAPENAADYGLDAPRLTVTVGTDAGSHTLLVGSVNETTGDVYIQMLDKAVPDDPEVLWAAGVHDGKIEEEVSRHDFTGTLFWMLSQYRNHIFILGETLEDAEEMFRYLEEKYH